MMSLTLALLMILPSAHARTQTTNRFNFHQIEVENDPTQACQLKRFTVFNSNIAEARNSFTSMAAVIDTTGPECIHNYAVVQYIRGCVYEQVLHRDTNTFSDLSFLEYQSRGVTMDFNLPEWRVDSLNKDAIIASKDPGVGGERMGWYYVPKKPLILENNRESLKSDQSQVDHANSRFFLENAGNMNPTQIYVTDMPSPAYQYAQAGSNIAFVDVPSLELKTCVYDINDVPTTGNPATPDTPHTLGGPIACYDWSHKFEYSAKTHKFKRVIGSGIDPVCTQPGTHSED